MTIATTMMASPLFELIHRLKGRATGKVGTREHGVISARGHG